MFVQVGRVLALTLFVSSAAAHAADPRFAAAKRHAIDAAFTQSFAVTKAPGAVVGIWMPGEGAYVATRGFADARTKQPMRSTYYFRIGSITKTFTATALLILADEKKLSLDDPVSKYANWVPNGDNITLRMLADMTAGLHSYTEDDGWIRTMLSNLQRVWTPRELVDVGISQPPDFPPGKGWHYSNTNYVLLGMILEQASGKKIQDLFAEKIFRPLKLRHTVWPTTPAMPHPEARGVTMQTLDDTRADATNRNPSWAFTAGQLISTMADLHVWVRSYTTGTLISKEMQRERVTWMTMPPNTPVRHYGIGIGEDNGWLGHTGELPGYNTAAYYLPAKKAIIVIEVNSDIPVGKDNPAPTIMKALTKVVTPGNVPE
jgi:D-alanyl-D-alanine carboxypeptidase